MRESDVTFVDHETSTFPELPTGEKDTLDINTDGHGVGVGVLVPAGVGVAVCVRVAAGVDVAVAVPLGVEVAVATGVGVGQGVLVANGVGTNVGCTNFTTLGPFGAPPPVAI